MKKILLFSSLFLFVAGGIGMALMNTGEEGPSYSPRAEAVGDSQYGFQGALEYQLMVRAGKSGQIEPAEIFKAEQQVRNRSGKNAALGLQYSQLGPDNIGGRTRAMLIDRDNPETVFAGSVSGGLFVSKNKAARWEAHPDFQNTALSSSVIASIAQAPNGDIYVGTGTSFENNVGLSGLWPGKGIFRSTDHGESFTQIASTNPLDPVNNTAEEWHDVNRIDFDPNTGRIYAVNQRGLRISDDNGETWVNPVFVDPPTNNIPAEGVGMDINVTDDGTVYVAVQGVVYKSLNGDVGTYERLTGNGGLGGGSRIVLDVAPSDNNYVYVMTVEGDGSLGGVYQSKDGGENWNRVLQDIVDYFEIMGDNGQGYYDACITVDPNNPGRIFMGGVDLWKWDGNLTQAATTQAGLSPGSDFFEFYVHADKHFFYWDPTDETGKTLYITHDGGMSRSEDGGNSFIVVNKGYTTLQNYAISIAPVDGVVIGGAQDNGTNIVGLSIITGQPNTDPLAAFEINGGDGFDSEISQISQVSFVTSQYSCVSRGSGRSSTVPFAPIAPGYCGQGTGAPFYSSVRLWESLNDPTSKDSIDFAADTTELGLAVGNGVLRTFEGNVTPVQSAAKIVKGSVEIIVGSKKLTNANNDTILEGDGFGTIKFINDKEMFVSATFDDPPTINSTVFVRFSNRYDANSILNLTSATASVPVQHKLEVDLNPGDVIKVQDPVQSMVAISIPGGIAIARGALITSELPVWLEYTDEINGSATALEWTPDGNHLFVGTSGGNVHRISGLNDLYEFDDIAANTTVTTVLSGGQAVTGIDIDHNDPQNIVVTQGRYGFSSNVKYITNSLTNAPNVINVHTASLPQMPIYDAEIDINDPKVVLLGTDMGVWATDDITAAQVEWSDENQPWTYVPVYDIRQQKLPWNMATNTGIYYFGSHGKGIWKSTTLVSANNDADDLLLRDDFVTDLKVYPNPMQDQGTISFILKEGGEADVRIYDLGGREIRTFNQRQFQSGENNIQINSNDFPVGTYFVTIGSGDVKKVAKFVVIR